MHPQDVMRVAEASGPAASLLEAGGDFAVGVVADAVVAASSAARSRSPAAELARASRLRAAAAAHAAAAGFAGPAHLGAAAPGGDTGRSTVVLTLTRGSFAQDAKRAARNMQADSLGPVLCDEYRTAVFYHTNAPVFMDKLSLVFDPAMGHSPDDAHVLLSFWHASSTEAKTHCVSFSFFRLTDAEGVAAADGSHELLCFRPLAGLRPDDSFIIHTRVISKSLTSLPALHLLLRWRTAERQRLCAALGKLRHLPAARLLPCLHPLLSALSELLASLPVPSTLSADRVSALVASRNPAEARAAAAGASVEPLLAAPSLSRAAFCLLFRVLCAVLASGPLRAEACASLDSLLRHDLVCPGMHRVVLAAVCNALDTVALAALRDSSAALGQDTAAAAAAAAATAGASQEAAGIPRPARPHVTAVLLALPLLVRFWSLSVAQHHATLMARHLRAAVTGGAAARAPFG
ncbi:hypothetical protein FNF27_02789 [Cafeteria roenbergensis]|uniref:C2 DOCK-type domain-containing protein n=1 Tax=Cafeteria roenbergensis TaxID=33653 RepID=A0A5A8ECX4_CAFRO|nr:hypothetical protein FNF27_02789 [Cafeteria roenbergensis]